MQNKLTIDFETRSEADIVKVGAWMYSRHPSTVVMTIGWTGGQWRMGDEPPAALFEAILLEADVIEAHNSFFEYCIWLNVCVARMGWPAVPDHMWRCSLAKASVANIPRGLGNAGKAMNVKVLKDEEYGRWAMMKLSKPRKPTRNNPAVWHDEPADWDLMLAYNRNDVVAEEYLSAVLPDLTADELETWRMSNRMNIRGIPFDIVGVIEAIKLAGAYALKLTKEFQKLTGLQTAGQRAKFTVWLASNNIHIPDTTAGTLDALLTADLKPNVRRAIEIARTLGRSSIKKYRAMLAMLDADNRARGCFLYHGASTGRWAGSGLQPQNFPRAYVLPQDQAWKLIRAGDIDTIDLHSDLLEFLSGALRGAICAPPDRKFYCADFAQIEVRVLFWLAGEKAGLDVFRSGLDVYLVMASMIYNRPVTKDETLERFLGKQATLALGFGAGFVKFLVHCRALGAPPFTKRQIYALMPADQVQSTLDWIMTDGWDMVTRLIPNATKDDAMELVLTKYVVDKYRARHKHTVVAFWKKLEDAVRAAIVTPGRWFAVGKIKYGVRNNFLECVLPSGRTLYYREPRLDGRDITYMSVEDGQWRRTKTYGGKLAENVTQAAARDVMVHSMKALEKTAYRDIVATVHDEVLCETPDSVGSLEEFLGIVSAPLPWAPDLPVKAEGWEGKRYRK